MSSTSLDWADEIAARVYSPDLMDVGQVLAMRSSQEAFEAASRNKLEATKQQRHEIAAALRKAKADGMREAIFRFEQRYNNVDPYEDIYWVQEIVELLRDWADGVEQGAAKTQEKS